LVTAAVDRVMSDTRTGADLFVEALEEYGVDHIFGNPGTTELPITQALPDSAVEYVMAPHEDVAVGMAAGYASVRRQRADRIDGTPAGVVNLHVAPGLAHGLGNLYGAHMAGAPLVVTAGAHARGFRHEEPILDGDLVTMADQFTKESREVLDVDALPTILRRAFKTACTPPTGPVFLALPMDVMDAETDAAVEPLDQTIPNAGRGDPAAIDRATDVLVDAETPVLVLGDHVARHAAWSGVDPIDAAVDLAEESGARVHGEILACEVNFPADHDQWVSYVPPDEDLARTLLNSDTVAFVGCSTNTTLWAHEGPLVPDRATVVHVSEDPHELGKNQPGINVAGDPGLVMADLAERVGDRLAEGTRAERLDDVAATKEFVTAKMAAMGDADTPADEDPRPAKADVVDAMETAAPDALVVDESVTAKYALLTRWAFGSDQLLSNKGGGLGYGLPAAVGAALAERERDDPRTVLGFVGDGSYLYYPHAMYAAARLGVDLTVVVPDNRGYRILKENVASIYGGDVDDHEYVGMEFDPAVDLVANAESHGASGRLVEDRESLAPALEEALGESGPSLVDVLVRE
jgi:benzoylformate decarboxylase